MHMLGAGHIRYYLKRWRNLNRFQNQGWEACNAVIASFWHHRTKRGDGGKNEVDRSKIKGRWILRLMLWKTGAAKEYFQNLERQNVHDGDNNSDDNSSLYNSKSESDYDHESESEYDSASQHESNDENYANDSESETALS
jgi:hypothetical protein